MHEAWQAGAIGSCQEAARTGSLPQLDTKNQLGQTVTQLGLKKQGRFSVVNTQVTLLPPPGDFKLQSLVTPLPYLRPAPGFSPVLIAGLSEVRAASLLLQTQCTGLWQAELLQGSLGKRITLRSGFLWPVKSPRHSRYM